MAKSQDETKDSSITTENMTIITELNENDCLCGKERQCVNHPGSRKFRATIDEYATKYNDAVSKQEKMAVTKEIYDALRAEDGRFLKYDAKANGWIELSSLLARDKISHALRFANRDATKAASVSSSNKKKGHRRGDSETSTDSHSTYTTVASQMSFDEFEDLTMDDDEPLNYWQAEGEKESEQPYVYEVSYESTQPVPPPAVPYYHGYGGPYPPPYPYPHYGYHHYGHYRHYYPAEPTPTSYPATPASAPVPATTRPAPVERDVSTMSSFPEKPLPDAPARKSTMEDVDLAYLVNEPLMDWDLKTEEVFICH